MTSDSEHQGVAALGNHEDDSCDLAAASPGGVPAGGARGGDVERKLHTGGNSCGDHAGFRVESRRQVVRTLETASDVGRLVLQGNVAEGNDALVDSAEPV